MKYIKFEGFMPGFRLDPNHYWQDDIFVINDPALESQFDKDEIRINNKTYSVYYDTQKGIYRVGEKRVAIVATMIKNEHRFLNEWIEYHLNLGFDKILLYEDNTSKPHNELIEKYGYKVELKRAPSGLRNPFKQMLFNQNTYITYYNSNSYILFIDADEYLTFADGFTLDDLIAAAADKPALQLAWQMIGCGYNADDDHKDCGVTTPETGSIFDIFPAEEFNIKQLKPYAKYYKCFANMNCPTSIVPPHDITDMTPVDSSLDVIKMNQQNIPDEYYASAYIRHYYTGSWLDWCMKFNGRDPKKAKILITDFFRLNGLESDEEFKEKCYNNEQYKEYIKTNKLG